MCRRFKSVPSHRHAAFPAFGEAAFPSGPLPMTPRISLVLACLVGTVPAAAQSVATTLSTGLTTYWGPAVEGLVAYRTSSGALGGVRLSIERHEVDRESIFPVPPDTVTTQTATAVFGYALRPGGAFSRSTSRLTPILGVGAMRRVVRSTGTASAPGRQATLHVAGVFAVESRVRLARLSDIFSVDGTLTPSLTVSPGAAYLSGSVGVGLTWNRRDRHRG